MLPKPPSWPGRGHPSTDPIPCRRLRRLDPQSASGARIYLPVHIISDYTPLISTYATCAHIRTGAVRNCLKRQTANTNQKLEWIINSRWHVFPQYKQLTWLVVTEVRRESFGLRDGHRAPSLKRTSCCDAFSSSSVISRTFSALCVYSTFGHHLRPLGYLCAKFCFFRGPYCCARSWRKIAYSLIHTA